mmetsp:Transcript_39679/g.71199  ORF Transcript_39679/g.71199 Transcript_39679/m.71199 type:complete len:384 (-) Transcript_39679:356-1507(-)
MRSDDSSTSKKSQHGASTRKFAHEGHKDDTGQKQHQHVDHAAGNVDALGSHAGRQVVHRLGPGREHAVHLRKSRLQHGGKLLLEVAMILEPCHSSNSNDTAENDEAAVVEPYPELLKRLLGLAGSGAGGEHGSGHELGRLARRFHQNILVLLRHVALADGLHHQVLHPRHVVHHVLRLQPLLLLHRQHAHRAAVQCPTLRVLLLLRFLLVSHLLCLGCLLRHGPQILHQLLQRRLDLLPLVHCLHLRSKATRASLHRCARERLRIDQAALQGHRLVLQLVNPLLQRLQLPHRLQKVVLPERQLHVQPAYDVARVSHLRFGPIQRLPRRRIRLLPSCLRLPHPRHHLRLHRNPRTQRLRLLRYFLLHLGHLLPDGLPPLNRLLR